MDFTLSENHQLIARTVYDFARKTVMPVIKEHDRTHTSPTNCARRWPRWA